MKITKWVTFSSFVKMILTRRVSISKLYQFFRKTTRPQESLAFFSVFYNVLALTKTRNARGIPLVGFPYLRTNRFLIGLSQKITNDAQRECLVQHLQRFTFKLVKHEVRNFPDWAYEEFNKCFDEYIDETVLLDLYQKHTLILLDADKRNKYFNDILKMVHVDPGEYSVLLRIIGLYPLTSVIVAIGTFVAYKNFEQWHQMPEEKLSSTGSLQSFVPPECILFSSERKEQLFGAVRRDKLGISRLNDEEVQQLAVCFAPVFTVDINDTYDQFGEVVWKDGKVSINQKVPAVYYYLSHSLINQIPVLQINYSIWYSQRTGPKTSWVEKGKLDGMTVRVTLDTTGNPVMVDSMNNCGCYFFYVPRKEKIVSIVTRPLRLSPLVPTYLPKEYPDNSLQVRINSGCHQVEHVSAKQSPEQVQNYALIPYNALESLPHEEGRKESVFDDQGVMKNSYRIEPYLFFSMGIPRVGCMRQRGNHPIKLVGHAHFTDAHLYERDFQWK